MYITCLRIEIKVLNMKIEIFLYNGIFSSIYWYTILNFMNILQTTWYIHINIVDYFSSIVHNPFSCVPSFVWNFQKGIQDST